MMWAKMYDKCRKILPLYLRCADTFVHMQQKREFVEEIQSEETCLDVEVVVKLQEVWKS